MSHVSCSTPRSRVLSVYKSRWAVYDFCKRHQYFPPSSTKRVYCYVAGEKAAAASTRTASGHIWPISLPQTLEMLFVSLWSLWGGQRRLTYCLILSAVARLAALDHQSTREGKMRLCCKALVESRVVPMVINFSQRPSASPVCQCACSGVHDVFPAYGATPFLDLPRYTDMTERYSHPK